MGIFVLGIHHGTDGSGYTWQVLEERPLRKIGFLEAFLYFIFISFHFILFFFHPLEGGTPRV